MEAPSSEKLCSICQGISIVSLFTTELEHEEAIALGPLEDVIRKSKDCSCCETILHALQAQQAWQKLDADRILKILQVAGKGTDIWLYSYAFIGEQESVQPILRIGVSASRGPQTSRLGWRKHVGDLQIMQASAERAAIPVHGRGRKIGKTVDIALARTWLDECLRDHGVLCSQPSSKPGHGTLLSYPAQLRVIDVRQRFLVALPDGAEYIVLSYCWPKEPGLKNTSTSGIDFSKKGAISTLNGLSTTIDDACSVVYELDELYLWVDALCIKQDDWDDKALQIGQMDLVYGNAMLTIIAAPDKVDVEELGLPGYSAEPQSRQQTIRKTQSIELAIPKPCLEDVLGYTRWETRGWTFQEAHLSRRSLCFTSQQVYYQCACGIRCEDTAGEGHQPSVYIKHSTNLWNPKSIYVPSDKNYGDLFLSRSAYKDDEEALRAHDIFVLDFGRRELSFPSDILNAFQGIIKVLSVSMDTEFYAGLPIKWLDYALLWQLHGVARRREDFPSFSWVGWEASADSPFWLGTPTSIRLLVTWHRFVAGRFVPCGAKKNHDLDKADALVQAPYLFSGFGWKPSGTFALAANTQVASFGISCDSIEFPEAPNSEHVWIMDTESRRAGLVLLDKIWKAEHVNNTSKHDFILLSRAERSRADDIVGFDEACYEQREWCLLNVMLVAWLEDGIAERVAVGTVHCDAWLKADTDTRTVCLV